MLVVKFNTVEEFLQELEKERGNVHRRIVRITGCRTSGQFVGFFNFSLIATFVVVASSATLPIAGNQIVCLKRQVGSAYFIDGKPADVTSTHTMESLDSAVKNLTERIEAIGFVVRGGVYEAGGELNATKAP